MALPLSDLTAAINRLADEFHAYNQQHEPQKRQRGEAELFKADSEVVQYRTKIRSMRPTGQS